MVWWIKNKLIPNDHFWTHIISLPKLRYIPSMAPKYIPVGYSKTANVFYWWIGIAVSLLSVQSDLILYLVTRSHANLRKKMKYCIWHKFDQTHFLYVRMNPFWSISRMVGSSFVWRCNVSTNSCLKTTYIFDGWLMLHSTNERTNVRIISTSSALWIGLQFQPVRIIDSNAWRRGLTRAAA